MIKVDDFSFHFYIKDFVLYRAKKPEWMFSTAQACLAWNGKFANKQAGNVFRPSKSRTRYIRIKLNGKSIYAHRVIWTMIKGDIPSGMMVDHINGDGLDNRIENLRLVTPVESARNMPMQFRRTGSHHGVKKAHFGGGWAAYIGVSNKEIYLGTFKTVDEAISARKRAELDYGFNKNHGRPCNAH